MNNGLTITIPLDELPRPGEVIERWLAPNVLALIENTEPPLDEVSAPTADEAAAATEPLTWYEVVDVRGATRTHAALVRQHDRRSMVNRYTLCSVSDSRRVTGRRRDQQLSTVTCSQCRRRLELEGEL